MDPAQDAPGSSSPPPPPPPPHPSTAPRRSYAAASAFPASSTAPHKPPPVPPKPAGLQPVQSSNFFGTAAANPSSSSSPTTSSRAPPARPRRPSAAKITVADADASADDSDDPLRLHPPRPPAAAAASVASSLKKRQSPPVIKRVYGRGGIGSTSSTVGAAMRRQEGGTSGEGAQPWDDEWAQGNAPPPPPPPAPAPAPWQTVADDPSVWGGQSWEDVVRATNGSANDHDAGDVRIVAATPSPPLAPSSPKLLEWAPGGGGGARTEPEGPVAPTRGSSWTTPRVLASPGELAGGRTGVWAHEAWDFEVGFTPVGEVPGAKDLRYRPMGEWIPLGEKDGVAAVGSTSAGSEDTSMAADDGNTDSDKPLPLIDLDADAGAEATTEAAPAPPPKPERGFHTITAAELSAARPHPNLYFCPRTFSWALFAPLVRPASSSSSSSSSPDAPALWHVEQHCVPAQLSRYFSERLVGVGSLPLPAPPVVPARPDMFSAAPDPRTEANAAAFEDALGGLVELQERRGDRIVCVGGTAFYPAVIPRGLWERLMRTRGDDPPVDKKPDEMRWEAAKLIWRAIDNVLFAGETRSLPTTGKHMAKYMPADSVSRDIFVATLGFRPHGDAFLASPHLDQADPVGRENRARLLRCWLEIGIWLEDFAKASAGKGVKLPQTRITLKSAKPALQAMMGGDDLPRAPQHGAWSTVTSSRAVSSASASDKEALAADYDRLGVTPDLTDSVIARVYDAQLTFDRSRDAVYLEALVRIARGRDSAALQEKVAIERSLDRYPASEVVAAFRELRLDNPFEAYVSEERLVDAFDKRNSEVEHRERRRILFEQAKVVATFTGSDTLKAMLASIDDEIVAVGAAPGGQQVVKARMDLDAANRALGIESEVDDTMIATLYNIRLEDASTDTEKAKMREALEVIADARDSAELRTLAKTGKRADDVGGGWQAGPAVDANLPVGLTNIANTCYLNSLLQYFFTVREVRDTILAFHDTPTPPSQQAQLRVGGRLVSLGEVKRSKRFVALLQTLYQQLIHAPVSAVTPETELAYLALVPSREEAEASSAPAATATLTEEPEPLADGSDKPAEASAGTGRGVRSPSSVLGKRKVDEEGPASPSEASDMQLDQQQQQQTPLSSPSLASGGAHMASLSLASASASATGASEDAEMADAEEGRRSKRGKSEEDRLSVTEPQAPSPAEGSTDEPMSLDVAADQADAPQQPPPLPPRRTPLAPSPEPLGPPPPTKNGAGGSKDKEKELERQVSSYMAFGRQNDVTECMDNVMFQVEAALLANAPSGQVHETAGLLRRTFYGTMRQQLVFDDPTLPDPIRTQDEPFSSLLVDVAPSPSTGPGALARDIYDGLDAVFAPSPITLEGHAAQRRVALVAPPPPVLQIQLQRVQYDREKQSVYKSNAHLQFYEEIGVRRYVEVAEGDEEGQARVRKTQELRRVLERTRARLAELTKDKSTNTATVLRATSSHFSHLMSSRRSADSPFGIPDSLSRLFEDSPVLADTEAEAADLDKEIDELKQRIGELRERIKAVWDEVEDGTRYELTAVFIHRGTALSGHYYIYQRDHRNPQRWLRYNDSVVSEVDKDEVFRETTGDTNAYFLAYVRKDCRDAIESIKRD